MAKGWSWKLLVLPILALLDVVVVALYGVGALDITDLGDGVRVFHVVLAGLVVLLVLLAVELLLLARTFAAEGPADLEAAAPRPEAESASEPVPEEAPAPMAAAEGPDMEALATADEYEGRRVVEVARPPKNSHPGAIYATTYVPVNGSIALRLEEMVAYQG